MRLKVIKRIFILSSVSFWFYWGLSKEGLGGKDNFLNGICQQK